MNRLKSFVAGGAFSTPHSRHIWRDVAIGFGLIVTLFGGVFGWMAFAPIASSVISEGTVKVEASRQIIQTTTGGQVSEVHVRDGDIVSAGQPLVTLHDARVSASLTLLSSLRDTELAKQARLEAEQAFAPTIRFPATLTDRASDPRIAGFLTREQDVFVTRRNALMEQIQLLKNQEQEVKREYQRYSEQLSVQKDALEIAREQLADQRKLFESQFISKARLLDFERSFKEYQARLHEIEGEMSSILSKGNDYALRAATLRSGYMEDAARNLKDNSSRLLDLEQQILPSEEAAFKLVLTAPMAGQVFNLRVHTIGELVPQGNVVAELVPERSEMIVEASIPVREIKHVRVGSLAQVRFTAYNQRVTPEVKSVVSYISPDRVGEKNDPNPGYLVRLKLDRQSLHEAGDLEVVPGMSATVFIRAEDRTMLNYILQPFIDSFSKAFRETY